MNYLGKLDNYPKNICNIDSIDIQNLGTIFTIFNPKVIDEEILHRKTAAETRMGKFMIVFSNNYSNMKIKLLFYDYYVRTRLCYGKHTWNFKSKNKGKKLESFHIKLLQHLVKKW